MQPDTEENRAIYARYIIEKLDKAEQASLGPKVKQMISTAKSIEFAQKLATFTDQGVREVIGRCEAKGLI